MKTLYLDIFSGISGDMFIGAMLDLGVDARRLETELRKLGVEGYHLHTRRSQKQSISGVKFDVHLEHDHAHEHEHERADEQEETHEHEHVHRDEQGGEYHHSHGHHHHDDHAHHHHHEEHAHEHEHQHEHEHSHTHGEHEHGRTFSDIKQLIAESALSGWVKEKATGVFRRIAIAEGAIHGLAPDKVHFHEVGAVDSIVDIVGACICLEMLGKPRVLAGPVVEGTGFIKCAHGRFPIPAPATLAILGQRKIPISQSEEPNELITPTGAALLAEFVEEFGPMRGIAAEKIGFGLGTRDNRTRPNVLRAVLGEAGATSGNAAHDWEMDTIAVLEANVDDLNPEVLGHFVGQALDAGALDVFHTAIQMKKNRPGILLTVLCAEADADRFCEVMLRQTSTFGVRRSLTERRKLRRDFRSVTTKYGEATLKLGMLNGEVVQVAPEFESCRKLAAQGGATLKEVYAAALNAYYSAR